MRKHFAFYAAVNLIISSMLACSGFLGIGGTLKDSSGINPFSTHRELLVPGCLLTCTGFLSSSVSKSFMLSPWAVLIAISRKPE